MTRRAVTFAACAALVCASAQADAGRLLRHGEPEVTHAFAASGIRLHRLMLFKARLGLSSALVATTPRYTVEVRFWEDEDKARSDLPGTAAYEKGLSGIATRRGNLIVIVEPPAGVRTPVTTVPAAVVRALARLR